MAVRLDKSIVRGEISNEERDLVVGRIWLLGRKEPVELQLQGNCLRDIAGCTLTFENPLPRREPEADSLDTHQEGTVGDMTGSRKAKIFTVPQDQLYKMLQAKQQIPTRLANCLYLEWFSDTNGRVVIESTDYQMHISEPAWTMTELEEQEQANESKENFYEFLDKITGATIEDDDDIDFVEDEQDEEEEEEDGMEDSGISMMEDDEEPLDEFQWEQELREADRRAQAYQEAVDRYRDNPDRERLIAEAMGWDAEEFLEDFEDVGDEVLGNDPAELIDSAESLVEDEPEMHHPLSKRAMKFALRLQQDADARGLLLGHDKTGKESPLLAVVVSIISLGGKLAAALDGTVLGYEPDPGFVIAMLKRAQIPLNEAMHALSSIEMSHLSKDTQMRLATGRSELFDLRKDILDLMKELRQR